VATCGTALGETHLDLLRRFTEKIVLAFDSDAAGAGAALRGFEHSVPGDLDLRVAQMPEGRDPADLVSEDMTEVLLKAVDESEPLLQFRIDRELASFDLSEAEARGRAVRACADLIAKHPDAVVRHEYAVLVSRRTGVDLAMVENAVASAVRSSRPTALMDRRPPPVESLSGAERAERELLRLILANDPSVRDSPITADLFENDDHRAVFDLINNTIMSLPPGEAPDLGSLIGSDESSSGRLARELALVDRPTVRASDLLNRLKVEVLDRRIQDVRRNLETLDPEEDQQMYSTAFSELIALERERREMRGIE
jgi:DNA primase